MEYVHTHARTQFIPPGGLNPKGQLCTSTNTVLKMDPGLPKPVRPPFLAYILTSSVLFSAGPRGLVTTLHRFGLALMAPTPYPSHVL